MVETFTSAGTWTKPKTAKTVLVAVGVGGRGFSGGGGSSSSKIIGCQGDGSSGDEWVRTTCVGGGGGSV